MSFRVGRMGAAAGFIVAAVGLGLGVPWALAHDKDDDDDHEGGGGRAVFVYAAKVICGSGVTTTINVHNPGKKAAKLTKKGIALDNGQVATAPGDRQQESLNSDWALQMGCDDLRALGAVGPAGFGDAIVESSSELDVWAVYLTGSTPPPPPPGGGGSQPTTSTIVATEVVRVPATQVKK